MEKKRPWVGWTVCVPEDETDDHDGRRACRPEFGHGGLIDSLTFREGATGAGGTRETPRGTPERATAIHSLYDRLPGFGRERRGNDMVRRAHPCAGDRGERCPQRFTGSILAI
jgi:hypothetical protein